MPPSKRFMELLDVMRDIHVRKNAGYSGDSPDAFSNFRESEDFNVSAFKGCMVRMSDKWSRIKCLSKNPDNDKVGEAITDTLIDLANYSIIAVCLYEEENRKESVDEGIVCTKTSSIEDSYEHTSPEVFRRGGDKVG
jgi:hypothetical protein